MVITCVSNPQRARARIEAGAELARRLHCPQIVVSILDDADDAAAERSRTLDCLYDACRHVRAQLQLLSGEDAAAALLAWLADEWADDADLRALLVGASGPFRRSDLVQRLLAGRSAALPGRRLGYNDPH